MKGMKSIIGIMLVATLLIGMTGIQTEATPITASSVTVVGNTATFNISITNATNITDVYLYYSTNNTTISTEVHNWTGLTGTSFTNTTVNLTGLSADTYYYAVHFKDNGSWDNTTINGSFIVKSNPVAKFDWSPVEPTVGQTVTFDASDSETHYTSISTYHWKFGDDETGVGETTTHTYDEAGEYVVKLTITDFAGASATVKHTITVVNATTGAGVPPGQGSYTLTVNVRDTGGNAISGASVGLYSNGILLSTATTDSNGQATFSQVSGLYMLKSSKVGYSDATGYVTVNSDTSAALIMTETAEYMGLSLLGWITAFLIVLGIVAMLIVKGIKEYSKYWWVPVGLIFIAFLTTIIFPVFPSCTFSIWLFIVTVGLLAISIAVFYKEIKRATTKW